MKAGEERLLQLGEIIARCQVERVLGRADDADRVLAGVVTAACILLPPRQWAALLLQGGLDTHQLRRLVALVPRAETNSAGAGARSEAADPIEA